MPPYSLHTHLDVANVRRSRAVAAHPVVANISEGQVAAFQHKAPARILQRKGQTYQTNNKKLVTKQNEQCKNKQQNLKYDWGCTLGDYGIIARRVLATGVSIPGNTLQQR